MKWHADLIGGGSQDRRYSSYVRCQGRMVTRNKQNENKQKYRQTSIARVNNQPNHGRGGSGVSSQLTGWIRSVVGLPDKYADPRSHEYQCRLWGKGASSAP